MYNIIRVNDCSGEIFQIKCANLNRYIFSLLNIEEKVYLFKSAHFISFLSFRAKSMTWGTGIIKGFGSKYEYFQKIASFWKYTDLFPLPYVHHTWKELIAISTEVKYYLNISSSQETLFSDKFSTYTSPVSDSRIFNPPEARDLKNVLIK